MSLRLIYGRTGTGKSTAIFKEIKENISEKNNKYIITPEQFSFSAEKNLLMTLGKNSTVNSEVITFNRMAERVSEEVGGKTETILTKSGKAMIIYSILEEQKSKLTFLKNSENNIELIMQTIKEFKKHGISINDLQEIEENSAINELLKAKLNDISNVYTKYEENIENRFIDEEDRLTKLAKRLENSNLFENSEIYIDEFSGFTKQEYDIIRALLKKAKRITFCFCMDSLNIGSPETDIFYSNKNTWFRLVKIANEAGIEVEQPIFCDTNFKFHNEELKHLEKNLYNVPYEKYNGTPENIRINITTNPYDEIEEVAKEITKLVRDEGLKYRDIAIITNNISEYSSHIKAILKETNNIPVFIDEKEDLSKNQIIKYILSILEIFSSNWSYESVMSYIKCGMLDADLNDIYDLENYAFKWGIRGSKWYKEEWNYEEENPNELRKKVVEPLLKLKEELDKGKNAINISKVLYEFIENNKIYDKIQQKIEVLEQKGELITAKNYKQSFEILIDVIDEMIELYQNEKMSFVKFKELLKIGLSYKELGNIPEVLDQVILGDVERTRSSRIKVAFIIGVNDGIFPKTNKNEGFLNDEERNIFKDIGKEIAKGTLELLYDEQFAIYKALTTPEKRLYLSYTSIDKEGKALRPSIIISKLKKLFPNLVETSSIVNEHAEITTKKGTFKLLLKELRKLSNGESIDEMWYEVYKYFINDPKWKEKLKSAENGLHYTNIPEKVSQENIKKLYGDTLNASISKLETYSRCPYSFLLKYGLNLKEKEEYKIRTIDTGSFMHDVVDTFFKKVNDVSSIEYKDISKIVEEIIEEKLNLKRNYMFTSSKKFIILTNRLKKLISKSIEYIVYQVKSSNFEILSNELEFTKQLDNIEIKGKVDRVDISKNGEYLRIIDYKSSTKNINLNDVFAGVQLQLLTYMDIISEKQQKEPAGVLYFNLIEPIINTCKNLSEEEIEEKIRKEFRMKGLIVADIKVVQMMDKTLEKGQSDIIPAYIDKDGNLSDARSNAISKEDFSKLRLKIRSIIKDISNEILSGNIDIKPIYDKKTKQDTCKYCEFKSICGFNEKTNCFRVIENKTKEELLYNM